MPKRDKTLAAFGRNVANRGPRASISRGVAIRTERGLSQEKLAEQANLDRTYVSGIERGVSNPGNQSRDSSCARSVVYRLQTLLDSSCKL